MKTSILITGQIGGNFALKSQIGGNYEESSLPFNGFKLTFETKKEAVAAIRSAYNSLVNYEPEMKNRMSGIRVNKSRTELYYDASKAII